MRAGLIAPLRAPSALLSLAARVRRSMGRYDRTTRALFLQAWLAGGKGPALLDYLLFRRDLGLPLTGYWDAQLRNALEGLRGRRSLGMNMLLERDPASLDSMPLEWFREGRGPALETVLLRRGGNGEMWLAGPCMRRRAWHEEFAASFGQAGRTVCLVGNAGSLRGAGLGRWFDAHDLVVRFNRFLGPDAAERDLGSKTSLQVVAPGNPGSLVHDAPWLALSGPDMLFRLRDWTFLRSRLEAGGPVLTFPLPVWRALVKRLHAPPSAGLLTLAWMRAVRGGWQGIAGAGFGSPPRAGVPYHHAFPRQRPSTRHNWPEEREILRAWRAEGLELRASLGS